MSKDQIIRAWKDEEYRNSLSPAQRARLPDNPAGLLDLTDEEMQAAIGGAEPMVASRGQLQIPPSWRRLCYTNVRLCKA